MQDYFLGSFVTVKPGGGTTLDSRDGVRAQVVAAHGRDLVLRYADGTHRPIFAAMVIMDADQSTPVWPPSTTA